MRCNRSSIEDLVEVAAAIDVSDPRAVPLRNRLVHADRDPSYTACVLDGVPVVESDGLVVDLDIGKVALRDDEFHPLLVRARLSLQLNDALPEPASCPFGGRH